MEAKHICYWNVREHPCQSCVCFQTDRASASWLQLREQTAGMHAQYQEFKGQRTGKRNKRHARQSACTVGYSSGASLLHSVWLQQPVTRLSVSDAPVFIRHVPTTSSACFLFPSSLPRFCSIYDFLSNLAVSRTLLWAINQPLKRTENRRRGMENLREAFSVV